MAPPEGPMSWEGQVASASRVAMQVRLLEASGYRVILTHGNGPQVGAILLQNEIASDSVPPNPLDVLVAQSQAQVGYALQLALQESLGKTGGGRPAVPLITLVRVSGGDPAFQNPSKPIGPLYGEERVEELRKGGWDLIPDPRGGYRRVVPSPRPVEILGVSFLKALVEDGSVLPVVAGGGGIPVLRDSHGLRGVEAVVDKDLTSGLLASVLKAELLLMITDVPCAYVHYGTPRERALGRLMVGQARGYMAEGHFPPGSMGPKVEAAIAFVEAGGARGIITDMEGIKAALRGEAGTTIVA